MVRGSKWRGWQTRAFPDEPFFLGTRSRPSFASLTFSISSASLYSCPLLVAVGRKFSFKLPSMIYTLIWYVFFSWWCSWCWLLGVIWGFLKILVPKPLVFPFVLLRKRNLLFVPPSGFWADDDWYDLQMERRLPLTRDVLRDLALAQRRWYPDTPKSYDSYWLIITIHPKEWLLFRVTGTFGPQTGIGSGDRGFKNWLRNIGVSEKGGPKWQFQ